MFARTRRIRSLRYNSTTNDIGHTQVEYEVTWEDGTVETFLNKSELPDNARLFLSGHIARPNGNCSSWFGLGWDHEPERLTVYWPTYHWLEYVVGLAIVGCFLGGSWTIIDWLNEKPLKLAPVAFVGSLAAFIGSLFLLRVYKSQLIFERSSVRQRMNYGFVVREDVWPRKNVLEAILPIYPNSYGGRDRNRSALTIRVRTENQIEWRRIGGEFSRGKARILATAIRQFVKTRIESE